MARAFTQAQKFGVEFRLSTEVTRLHSTSESLEPDPAGPAGAPRFAVPLG